MHAYSLARQTSEIQQDRYSKTHAEELPNLSWVNTDLVD
jgi:hypothetical protein